MSNVTNVTQRRYLDFLTPSPVLVSLCHVTKDELFIFMTMLYYTLKTMITFMVTNINIIYVYKVSLVNNILNQENP